MLAVVVFSGSPAARNRTETIARLILDVPVIEVDLDRNPTAIAVDDGPKCDRQGAVDAGELFPPVAAAKGDRSHLYAVLVEGHREMSTRGADSLRFARQSYFARTKHGARIAVAEGSEAFDLLDRLTSEHLQRCFSVDVQFGRPVVCVDQLTGNLAKRITKIIDVFWFDFQTRRRRMGRRGFLRDAHIRLVLRGG